MIIAQLRQIYHQQIRSQIIRATKGYPNNADGKNKASCRIAQGIIEQLGGIASEEMVPEQTVGHLFACIGHWRYGLCLSFCSERATGSDKVDPERRSIGHVEYSDRRSAAPRYQRFAFRFGYIIHQTGNNITC
jgi:hypothetical protein